MATQAQTISLAEFFEFMDSLDGRPSLEELQSRLEAIDMTFRDIAPWAHFGKERYQRNLIREGRHYHILALCWRSGQRSPIHDHANSICGVRVVKGRGTETVYEMTPCGQYKPISSIEYEPGAVVVSQDSDVHQVSNLQAEGEDLVTMHVYAPPLIRMKTYSLTGERAQDYVDPIAGLMDGDGI